MTTKNNCRNCGEVLEHVFVDLGMQPLANSYVDPTKKDQAETRLPLRPFVCQGCRLVQLPEYETPEGIFGDYAYFSSQSSAWVKHCGDFADLAVNRFKLQGNNRVLELASNDGALLSAFQTRGIQVLGIEPAHNIARYAQQQGIPTIDKFFGIDLAQELVNQGYQADLVCANNVLAHVPDIEDFVRGIELILAHDGVVSIEVPSLYNLIKENQFDTIYHEHFSYFSFETAIDVLERRGLKVFDVETLPTHGGSLRIFARREIDRHPFNSVYQNNISRVSQEEQFCHNFYNLLGYCIFPQKDKFTTIQKLAKLRQDGAVIAGYGAPAKLSTFLNYCGIGPETISFVVDSTPAKQNKLVPGVHIPILPESELQVLKPDVIFISAWNWKKEIEAKIKKECDWNPEVICRIQGSSV